MHPRSVMKDAQRASPFLHIHWTRGHPVLVHHAFGVEVGEGRPFLHVRQHGRVMHPEPAVRSTSAPTVDEHLQERILVDGVVTFAQSFGAVLVGGYETIVRLATEPHESAPDHSTLNKPGVLLSNALRALQHASSPIHGRSAIRQRTYSFRCSSQHSDGSRSERCRK